MRKILGTFEVFLGVFEKTKEKKDRAGSTALDRPHFKSLLMPLFLVGCFPANFQEGKQPVKAFGETAH